MAMQYKEALHPEFLASLPHSVIHSDLNDTNLLFNSSGTEVLGVIDFGDSIYSCTIFDPAIAAGYYSLGQEDPMLVFQEVLRGYVRVAPKLVSVDEVTAFFHAARGRVLLSAVM